MKESNNTIQSVDRAFTILDLIVQSEKGLRLCEITDATGLKSPTVHNLLRTLCEKQMVEKIIDKNIYISGVGIDRMFEKSRDSIFLQRCGDVMLQLQCRYSDIVFTFTSIRGGAVSVILRLSPDRPGILQRPVGMDYSPYSQSSGLVTMAFASESDIENIESRYLFEEYGIAKWKDRKVFENELRKVRSQGHAMVENERRLAFGVPVFDNNKVFLGSFGASITAGIMEKENANHLLSDIKSISMLLSEKR